MAGFFAVRRTTLARARTLKPIGYKILLELIVRCKCRRIVEVPIEWHYGQASRLKVLPHSIEMLRDLLRVRAKVRRGAYGRRP